MAYFRRGQLVEQSFTINTSASVTTLTLSTPKIIRCVGASTHTVQLPETDAAAVNQGFLVRNTSTGTITVIDYAFNVVGHVPAGLEYGFYCNEDLSWDVTYSGVGEDSPLRLRAGAIPDTKVYIESNSKLAFDGTGLKTPPVKSLIQTVPLSSYDLSTGATVGATFQGTTIPAVPSGSYIRVGFTLLSSGVIQVLWSPSALTFGGLVNPGTLFIKSGLPIGYIDLEQVGAGPLRTVGSATAIIENSVADVPRIWRFGSGAGGSGGAGDANATLESLKNQLENSYFQLVTPNIFSTDQSTKVDGASTGAYSLVDDTFNFSAAGETLISTDMLDPNEFKNNSRPINDVELSVFWDPTYVDTSAQYYVSPDGGAVYHTLNLSRIGNTNTYRGYTSLSAGISTNLLTQSAAGTSRELNTSDKQILSQAFTLNASKKYQISSVTVNMLKFGSPDGYVYACIAADNGGSPGTILTESYPYLASSIVTGTTSFTLPAITIPAGVNTYHLQIRTDNAYKTTFAAGSKSLSVQVTAAGSAPYAKKYDGTAWTASNTDNFTYSIRGYELDLRVKVVSSTAAKMIGYGIFYDKSVPASVSSGTLNIQEFEFSGSLDRTSFTLTKFMPDPDLLRVYDVLTGQVYVYGSFYLNGSAVVFESGQFYQPGQTIRLRFMQAEGSVFDKSDVNGLLLASNFLGSTDASIDRSQPGRGIFLRRPDGTLREITIDNNDQIVVYSV